MATRSPPTPRWLDLVRSDERERAVPVIKDGFVGIYRWHAKRTLRDAWKVRGVELDGELVGVTMLEILEPGVGYVYYVVVASRFQGHRWGSRLLDDALAVLRSAGCAIVYAAAEEDNAPSLALFRSKGFRIVPRDETHRREGGLGAQGLRSKMMVVHGEVLLGMRFGAGPANPV